MHEGHQQQLAVCQERVIAANNERAKADAERDIADLIARMELMEMQNRQQLAILLERLNAMNAPPRGVQCPIF